MAANVFAMDPEGTRAGLDVAGLAAQSGVAAGVPTLPAGNYAAPYAAAGTALLTKLEAEAGALVEFGLVTSAASVTMMETAEDQNTGQLRT